MSNPVDHCGRPLPPAPDVEECSFRVTLAISDERLHELDLFLSEVVAECKDPQPWTDLYDAIGELKARRYAENPKNEESDDV